MVLCELLVLFERGIIRVAALDPFSDLEMRLGLSIAAGDPLKITKVSMDLSWATDPYDRMIAVHAKLLSIPLVSKDTHLHAHFSQVVW